MFRDASGSGEKEAPDIVLKDLTFARLVDGRVAACGRASVLEYRRRGGRFEALQVSALLRSTSATEALRSYGDVSLRAPRLEGELAARRSTASGGVEAVAARGDRATTEAATLDGATGTLHAETPVALRGPGLELHGQRLLARTDGSEIRLFQGSTGKIALIPVPAPGKRGRR